MIVVQDKRIYSLFNFYQCTLMRGSRNFRQGGGGVQVSLTKKSSDNAFFSPQLILQKSNGQFQRNLSFFKVLEGVQHFPGGSNFYQRGGGSNCFFPIETHITCDFPGGGRGRTPCPPPPLDPHLTPEESVLDIKPRLACSRLDRSIVRHIHWRSSNYAVYARA